MNVRSSRPYLRGGNGQPVRSGCAGYGLLPPDERKGELCLISAPYAIAATSVNRGLIRNAVLPLNGVVLNAPRKTSSSTATRIPFLLISRTRKPNDSCTLHCDERRRSLRLLQYVSGGYCLSLCELRGEWEFNISFRPCCWLVGCVQTLCRAC
jgi:hypothetical protein